MRIEEVTTRECLTALRPAWDSLFAQAETASPFNSWVWMATWWDLFGQGKELRVFVVREGDCVVGIAPFYSLSLKAGPLQVRTLMQIGRGNCLTELLEILVARGKRTEVVRELSRYLAERRRGLWNTLIWAGVERRELETGLARLTRIDDPTDYEERTLPDTWAAFVKGLNKSMRDNIKYYPHLLARRGHEAHTRFVTDPDEMHPALDEFVRLHRARAGLTDTRRHDDRFGRASHQEFLHRVAPTLAEQGMMRIALLAVDGQNAAAQITLEHGDTIYIYYSGFDPAWRQYGVAMSVTADCIRDALERGVRRVNFLRGTGQFKQRWDTTSAPVGKLTLCGDSLLMDAGFLAYRIQRTIIYERSPINARFGVSPQFRMLGWVGRVLGQPAFGD